MSGKQESPPGAPAPSADLPSRDRPASLESTADRAALHRRIRRPLLVAFVVMWAASVLTYQFALFPLMSVTVLAIILLGRTERRHAQPRFAELESPPGVPLLRPFEEDRDLRV